MVVKKKMKVVVTVRQLRGRVGEKNGERERKSGRRGEGDRGFSLFL